MLRTKRNIAIAEAVLAVARAQLQYPGVTPAAIVELARKIEAVLAQHQGAVCTAALCVLVLKAIGVADPFNTSRLRPQ